MKMDDKVKYGDLIGKITSMHGPTRFQVEAEFEINGKTEIAYFNTIGTPQYKDRFEPGLKLVVIETGK
jgi:hypothetical protein